MQEKFEALKAEIKRAAGNPGFIHHSWFVQYHLEIAERIALELLEQHSEADREVVLAMVWLHDYGKILDFDHQYERTLSEAPKLLDRLGFDKDFAEKVVTNIGIMDRKLVLDMREAAIEVQIVSSADAASHFVGPFFSVYWHEHPEKNYRQLMKDEHVKIAKDWDRKMVLPEVREAFSARVAYQRERSGDLPAKFLKEN